MEFAGAGGGVNAHFKETSPETAQGKEREGPGLG